jgi:arylsulfatase I/J
MGVWRKFNRICVNNLLYVAGCKVLLTGGAFGSSIAEAAAERPSILFIMSDDQGYADVGFHGGIAQTPNLDRLREQGMELRRHYVQPQCTPTRAALMSGRYPYRTAMHAGVVLPGSDWGLPGETYTLAEMFRDAGYYTALIGKWHLGHRRESFLPENQGFDYFYGLYLGEVDCYFTHDYYGGHALHSQRKPVHTKGYMTDLFTEEAVRVIENKPDDKPLFLYLAHIAPHDPLQAKEEDLRKYPKVVYENRRTYLAMIDCMDQGIGKVLDALERKGIRDNTLIVFTSDNGGVFYREQFAHNTPLREGKGGAYEGGIRTPTLAVWDGKIAPGSTSDELVYVSDWYTTFMNLAGGTLPANAPALDGVDAWPVLLGGEGNREAVPIISHQMHALVTDEWTLVQNQLDTLDPAVLRALANNPAEMGGELYRIGEDIWQRQDVSGRYPERFSLMMEQMKPHYAGIQMSRFDLEQLAGPYPDDWGNVAVEDIK